VIAYKFLRQGRVAPFARIVWPAPGEWLAGVADGRATWARMFLEPVEEASGDADALVSRVAGDQRASEDVSAVPS